MSTADHSVCIRRHCLSDDNLGLIACRSLDACRKLLRSDDPVGLVDSQGLAEVKCTVSNINVRLVRVRYLVLPHDSGGGIQYGCSPLRRAAQQRMKCVRLVRRRCDERLGNCVGRVQAHS
jgi:hypothetical protein